MDLLIAANSVPLAQADVVPTSGTPQYATSGNAALNIIPTADAAYHANMMMAELVNLVIAAGLAPSGATWTQVAQAVSLLGKRYYVFESSGNFVVPAGVTWINVRAWGEGGSGAGSTSLLNPGGGGGAGGYAEGPMAVTPGQIIPIVVYGGIAGVQAGRATQVGSQFNVQGGGAATAGSSSATGLGGAGGQATGGALNIQGTSGTTGIILGGNNIEGGMGGTPAFAPGPIRATGGNQAAFNGNPGVFPGGGSTGCTENVAQSGGGLVVINF